MIKLNYLEILPETFIFEIEGDISYTLYQLVTLEIPMDFKTKGLKSSEGLSDKAVEKYRQMLTNEDYSIFKDAFDSYHICKNKDEYDNLLVNNMCSGIKNVVLEITYDRANFDLFCDRIEGNEFFKELTNRISTIKN